MHTTKLGLIGIFSTLLIAAQFTACDTESPPISTVESTLRAIDDGATFELEGDAIDGPGGGDDWDTINLIPLDMPAGASQAHTGAMADAAPLSIFTGGRKDIQEIAQWSHKSGSVPDKDDITNAYAAAYDLDGDLVIYFGADRFAAEGDAQIGFWFFQDQVQAEDDGSFSGEHQVGDLLVLANFEGGGTTANVIALEWVGAGGDQQGGTLLMLTDVTIDCSDPSANACAITNSAPTAGQWPYTPKGGSQGDPFPPQTFFEGAVNITKLFQGQALPCFASFMAETRSSTSVTASLKDFVLGSFPVCGVEITNQCISGDLNGDQSGFVYEFSGTVTNTGFGTLHDVTVTDQDQVLNLGSLGPQESVEFSGSFASNLNPASYSASVTAATSPGEPPVLSKQAEAATCPAVDRDPMISVSKTCETSLGVVDGAVVVFVDFEGQVCNTTEGAGAVALTNVEVVDDGGTPLDDSDDTPFDIGALAAGECKPYQGRYAPSGVNSSDPSEAMFSDTVTATGTAPFGFGEAEDSISASCKLCPATEPN